MKKTTALLSEYRDLFETCIPNREAKGIFRWLKGRRWQVPIYEEVTDLVGVPWYMVAIIHSLEAGCRFDRHLHNGDPLTHRTTHVPSGRPAVGTPPFTWIESAADALRLKRWDQVSDWSVEHCLYLMESYNGWGYRGRGVNTPYLWAMSNHYEKGKFVADGKFNPGAVSKQTGGAVLLKILVDLGTGIGAGVT